MEQNIKKVNNINPNTIYFKHNTFDTIYKQSSEIYYNLLPFVSDIKKIINALKTKEAEIFISNKLDKELLDIEFAFNKCILYSEYIDKEEYFNYFIMNLENSKMNLENIIKISKDLIVFCEKILEILVKSKLSVTPILKNNINKMINRKKFLIKANKKYNILYKTHIQRHLDIINQIETDILKIKIVETLDFEYINYLI